jgi:hypothetical protein
LTKIQIYFKMVLRHKGTMAQWRKGVLRKRRKWAELCFMNFLLLVILCDSIVKKRWPVLESMYYDDEEQ